MTLIEFKPTAAATFKGPIFINPEYVVAVFQSKNNTGTVIVLTTHTGGDTENRAHVDEPIEAVVNKLVPIGFQKLVR